MNKSFVLSGGRKNDRFESGFKPATLPDWQNGNVKSTPKPILKGLIHPRALALAVWPTIGISAGLLSAAPGSAC